MSRTWRRTGLRDVALVTVNDTDPRVTAAGGNGTGYLTMMFRVNGAPVYVTNSCKTFFYFDTGFFRFPISHPARTVMQRCIAYPGR